MSNRMKVNEGAGLKIEELREKGHSYQFIAGRLNIPERSVSYFCLKYGIESPNTKDKILPQTAKGPRIYSRKGRIVRRFTQEEDKVLLQMRQEGKSLSEIGRKLGRRHNSIVGRLYTLSRHEDRYEEAGIARLTF